MRAALVALGRSCSSRTVYPGCCPSMLAKWRFFGANKRINLRLPVSLTADDELYRPQRRIRIYYASPSTRTSAKPNACTCEPPRMSFQPAPGIPGFVARFVAQIPGDCWYSLVPIGTRRSSASPTSPNESQ
jgi:hypothetical protein